MRVALTFDAEHPDRPNCRGGDPGGLVETLSRAGIRSTFFLQGRWVQAYPEIASRILGDGHSIGNHSHFHARMPFLSDEGLRADILEAARVIEEVTGKDPRPWFRCPWGAGHDDERVRSAIRSLGYRHVGGHVLPGDWEPALSAADLQARTVKGTMDHGDGAIIVLHVWPEQTLLALPAIIGELDAAGAEFITIDELLTD